MGVLDVKQGVFGRESAPLPSPLEKYPVPRAGLFKQDQRVNGPKTLNPKPQTLNPKPQTLNPEVASKGDQGSVEGRPFSRLRARSRSRDMTRSLMGCRP